MYKQEYDPHYGVWLTCTQCIQHTEYISNLPLDHLICRSEVLLHIEKMIRLIEGTLIHTYIHTQPIRTAADLQKNGRLLLLLQHLLVFPPRSKSGSFAIISVDMT